MKYVMALMIVLLVVFTVGCDTELGHEDHDHDGDGIQDHAAEDHHDEEHDDDDHDHEDEEEEHEE